MYNLEDWRASEEMDIPDGMVGVNMTLRPA